MEGESKETKTGGSRPSTYISASAVRFVEAAGARVVPMLHTMSRKQIMKRFNAGADAVVILPVCIAFRVSIYSHLFANGDGA